MKAFTPVDDATATVSATTLTARAAIKKLPSGEYVLRLHNPGPSALFYAIGGSDVEAVATDIPLPAGAIETITVRNPDKSPETHIAAITSSGIATLYASLGHGV